MRKALLIGSVIITGFTCPTFAQLPDGGLYNSPDVAANVNGYWGDQGDGTYRNPILAVDFSDPDPIRVGDDFYMAASTFESAPGVTILHSKDLVNWEIIGGVFDHLGDFSEEFLPHKKGRYNLGVYAPSLRYHDGKFYVYVNLVSDGMCMATADNPAGPWKAQFLKDRNGKPLKVKQWTDPCPVWDDATGKAYLATSRAGGWHFWYSYLFEMTPDGTQLLDADADYMNHENVCYEWSKGGGTLFSPHHSSEGNKIYKRGDYYYIMHIEFFTKTAGTYVYRSKNIYGTKPDGTPGKPGDLGTYDVYRLDAPTPLSATVDSTDVMKIYKGPLHEQKLPGQGGLVDTPDGQWFYMAQFTDGNAGGRQPHLVPVTWINDWPVVGVNPDDELHGQMVWQYRKPLDSGQIILPQQSDDFSGKELKPFWCWNHQPADDQWSLTARKGHMRLYAKPTHTGSDYMFDANNLLNQRSMRCDTATVTVRVDVSKMAEKQHMGLAHFNGGVTYGWAGVVRQDGMLFLKTDKGTVKQEWGSPIRLTTSAPVVGEPLPKGTRYLFLRTSWGMSDIATYAWSTDGKTFHSYPLTYHMTPGNFRGDMTGIFTFNNQGEGYIDIDDFKYEVVNRANQKSSEMSDEKERAMIEQEIQQQLQKMSLDDKIGQMMQFSVDQITYSDPAFAVEALITMPKKELKSLIDKYGLSESFNVETIYGADGKVIMPAGGYTLYMLSQELAKHAGFDVDEQKMKKIFGEYRIGSILNMLGGSATLASFWNKMMHKMQAANDKVQDIPMLYGLDQVHGSTYTADGTLFPQHIGMCATFNPDLAKRMGEICAYETRASGVAWVFCPNLDLGRKPSWSRCYEGMGEDPYLASVMGTHYLFGLQGNNPNKIDKYHVGTCLKHYMGYGVPDNGIDRTPANVSEQDLREKYFEPFRVVFNAGALAAMTNSSILNGMNGVANKRLLTDWLKKDLSWDGMIITDWGDIENLRVRDHIAATKKEGIELAVNAGVDMIMVTTDPEYITLLKELVSEGKVSMERIDDAVTRILRLKYRLGLFDQTVYPVEDYPLVGSREFAEVALQTAIESEVLLKNEDNILPLHRGQKLLVCGPNANTMRGLNGGWSYTWQGEGQDAFTAQYNTIFEALQQKFGAENVLIEEGVSYMGNHWQMEDDTHTPDAVAKAAQADVIIACIGENSYAETTGNILDANLSRKQQRLVKALQKTGKPVVLVLNEGRPRLIHDLIPGAKAVIDIMLPGNYGGDALAELLAGDANFSGRLPFTYPSYNNAFTTYDYKICETRETMPGIYNYNAETNAEWWFGEGLSYTTFSYSNLRAKKETFGHEDELTFTVDVTNTGSRSGKEVVMLYSSDLAARDVIPDNRRLRAFKKIFLSPGETQQVTLSVKASDLAYVNRDGKWVLETGSFIMSVGSEKMTIESIEDFQWQSPNKNI